MEKDVWVKDIVWVSLPHCLGAVRPHTETGRQIPGQQLTPAFISLLLWGVSSGDQTLTARQPRQATNVSVSNRALSHFSSFAKRCYFLPLWGNWKKCKELICLNTALHWLRDKWGIYTPSRVLYIICLSVVLSGLRSQCPSNLEGSLHLQLCTYVLLNYSVCFFADCKVS